MSVITGRFAPSPTGPLHFGSVVAALASFLEARAHAGRWLVRIDDLDPPREEPGAAAAILRTLEALELHWDGEVLYQSTRGDAYKAALETLEGDGAVFPCACTRRDLDGSPYPGTCRQGLPPGTAGRTLRVRVDDRALVFHDAVQGRIVQHLETDCGDFVVRRADGFVAYHLACAVDDAWQGVNEVVRGADLIDSTLRQIHLQHLLGLPEPRYAHVPVVVDRQGRKLSKQSRAVPVLPEDARPALFHAVRFLGFDPPADAIHGPPLELLAWARTRWDLSQVSREASTSVYSSPAD
ncbi:MAG: tRNA glutamyl-Q(34) synthetase GluQRS [Gammaproteobacteria bacterium]|nr:tRNA glutamyl-Q(34) synthetase GluQRS [Gammaproteobacteria bacterium]